MNTLTVILIVAILFGLGLVVLLSFLMYKILRNSRPNADSNVLMQNQVEALRAQVSTSLAKTSESVNSQLGATTAQLQQQMNSVLQSLQNTTGQINTRLEDASRVVQTVSHQLGSLSQATEKIFEATKNISTLEDILKPPKLRGSMGEILLENVLREILPSSDFFEFQHTFKTGFTVDAVIKLQDGLIPIDAKFALDNFRKMVETKDAKEQELYRKEFVKNIKKHIDDISRKYILPDEGTFNFALMYIPAENIYYETMIRTDDTETDIYSYATKKYVFPVSPNSLYPYLMTLTLGLRGLKIEKRSKEIMGELARVYGDMEKFYKDFKTALDHLSDAGKRFADAEKKIDRVNMKLSLLRDGTLVAPDDTSAAQQENLI